MSPWKRKAIYLFISADGARLLKKNGDRFHSVCAELSGDFRGLPSASEAALTQMLQRPDLVGCALHIVVSDLLVHYFTTQSVQGLRSAGELEQLAEVRHSRLYDCIPGEWKVVIDLDRSRSGYLCCALEQSMLAGLTRVASAARTPIRSLQPALVASQRLVARRISGDTAWYVRADGQSCTISYRDTSGWVGIRVHRSVPDTMQGLLRLLRLEQLYFGVAHDHPQIVWLSSTKPLPEEGSLDENWTIRLLPDPLPSHPEEREIEGAVA